MKNNLHRLNDYREVAQAQASIATDGTPLQYARDGQSDRRRMFWLHMAVWLMMLGLSVAMIVMTHGNLQP